MVIVGEGAAYGIDCVNGDIVWPAMFSAMKPKGVLVTYGLLAGI